MAPVEWYYARDNRQQGPISAVELKQLAETGQLKAEDLVWREGLGQWIAAGKVKGLFDDPAAAPSQAPAAPPRPAPTSGAGSTFEASPAAFERARQGPPRHFFDWLLDLARRQFPAPLVDAASVMFAVAGHYGLYAAMGALLLYDGIVAVRQRAYSDVPLTLVWLMVLLVLQYVARRFLGSLEKLNRATAPAQMSSTAFLDSTALLLMFSGLAGLVVLTVAGLQTSAYWMILPAVGVFVLCEYTAVLALHPDTLNLTIRPETSFPEEAIGKLFFPMNVWLRLTPVAFGAGVVLGTVGLLYACLLVFVKLEPDRGPPGLPGLSGLSGLSGLAGLSGAEGLGALGLPSEFTSALPTLRSQPAHELAASRARTMVVGAAVLPWAMYELSLLWHLLVGVARAIIGLGRAVLPLPAAPDPSSDPQEPSKDE